MANGVVDLVRSGVEQILTFKINLRSAAVFGQAAGVIQFRRPAGKLLQMAPQFGNIVLIRPGFRVNFPQLLESGHERLRDEDTAVASEMTTIIR